jgi:DNA-binding response OmpR family regulator
MVKVLIAEHNQTTCSYLAAALKKAGNTVEVADNCLDAWRAASKDTYDVLMVDVVMPGIDGFVLAQKVLQENPLLQVIFITGFAGVAMDTHATPPYAPAPVTMRPFHLKEVASRVRYLMGIGSLPSSDSYRNNNNSVVYADFGSNRADAHQHVVI